MPARLREIGPEPRPEQLEADGAGLLPFAYIEGTGAYLSWLTGEDVRPEDWTVLANAGRGPESLTAGGLGHGRPVTGLTPTGAAARTFSERKPWPTSGASPGRSQCSSPAPVSDGRGPDTGLRS